MFGSVAIAAMRVGSRAETRRKLREAHQQRIMENGPDLFPTYQDARDIKAWWLRLVRAQRRARRRVTWLGVERG